MFDLLFFLHILKFILAGASCASAASLSFNMVLSFFERKFKKTILLSGLIFVVASIGIFCTEEKIYSELKVKAETGYAIYLEGQEVDVDTISFRHYNVSINDVDKTIMLTPKRNNSYRYVPIPILR